MIYTLQNINEHQKEGSIILKSKLVGNNKRPSYFLRNKDGIKFKLSDGNVIHIPENFDWDGSSVPRLFWWLFATDGDFEIASLIHDYLYVYQKQYNYKEKFVDKEMLKWSEVLNGTEKRSFRNFDNKVRYIAVRLFGWFVWRRH